MAIASLREIHRDVTVALNWWWWWWWCGGVWAGAYILSAVEIYFTKSRGITGIILVVTPGEFSTRKERLPAVGHTHDGVPDVFTLKNNERIVKMEISMGIVLEQIRCITPTPLAPL